MSKTAVIVGTLSLPQEDGQAAAPFKLDASFIYTQKAEYDLVYAGATSADPVALGTMAVGGAKLLRVTSPVGGCTIRMNAVALDIPVAPGGQVLFFNPSAGFVTGLTVTVTGAATVQVLALA